VGRFFGIRPLTRRKPCGYVGTWDVYKPVIDFNFWKKKNPKLCGYLLIDKRKILWV